MWTIFAQIIDFFGNFCLRKYWFIEMTFCTYLWAAKRRAKGNVPPYYFEWAGVGIHNVVCPHFVIHK